jgi:hypothetical protein
MIQQLAKQRYYFVAEIHEPQEKLASSRCRICKLLAILKSDDSLTFLHALSAGWLFTRLTAAQLSNLNLTDTALLRLDSKKEGKEMRKGKIMGNLIAVESTTEPSSTLLPLRLGAKTIDYGEIKSWITYCDKNHAGTCKLQDTTQIQSLKVIDCESYESSEPVKLELISMDQDYAALSYVWGEYEKSKSDGSESMAPVIKDSIAVTKILGCRYLWVDRHVR